MEFERGHHTRNAEAHKALGGGRRRKEDDDAKGPGFAGLEIDGYRFERGLSWA